MKTPAMLYVCVPIEDRENVLKTGLPQPTEDWPNCTVWAVTKPLVVWLASKAMHHSKAKDFCVFSIDAKKVHFFPSFIPGQWYIQDAIPTILLKDCPSVHKQAKDFLLSC
jgi:hypothetical protein